VKIFKQLDYAEYEPEVEDGETQAMEQLNESMTLITNVNDDLEDDEETHSRAIRTIQFNEVDSEIADISRLIDGINFDQPLTRSSSFTLRQTQATQTSHTRFDSEVEPEHELIINIGNF